MRNLIYGVLMALLIGVSAIADSRSVTYEQLPKSARELLHNHLAHLTINTIRVEQSLLGREYTVYFTNGDHIDFDKDGAWEEMEFRHGIDPTLLPKAIRRTIDKEFDANNVRSIERNRKGYEVELENGLELEFNHSGKLIDVDD